MEPASTQTSISSDTLNTLISSWALSISAMVIMVARLGMVKHRKQAFALGDYLTMVAIFSLIVRVSSSHISLLWGTNNMAAELRDVGFSVEEWYHREVGSKMMLVSRSSYNVYIWLQKIVVMLLLERVLRGQPWTSLIVKLYLGLLLVTFIVVQLFTCAECMPMSLYWQIQPDPGVCAQALVQVTVLGALNIFTDVILIVIPLPALFQLKQSWPARLRLIALFSLGIFVVLVTIVRLAINLSNGTSQNIRSALASVEIFTAGCVANIPVLYSLRKPRNTDGSSIHRARTGSFTDGESLRKMETGGLGGVRTSEVDPNTQENSFENNELRMDARDTRLILEFQSCDMSWVRLGSADEVEDIIHAPSTAKVEPGNKESIK